LYREIKIEEKEEVVKEDVAKEQEKFTSINGQGFKVRQLSFNKFEIGDTRNFTKYIRGGFGK